MLLSMETATTVGPSAQHPPLYVQTPAVPAPPDPAHLLNERWRTQTLNSYLVSIMGYDTL